ncbi:hypothetical protein G7Y89_g13315 [Cudoniella acicularis]|uniref:Uncharacterized protein n=1 Tax=Cudoniella acicularis TaxID=354080 RepID=A0A8H4VYU0_9HELO|nr:hypothetical protein G7Y89_g13315 [Cudoniella acicularis]
MPFASHSDPNFLGTLPSREFGDVVRGNAGLVALTVGIVAPDVSSEDEEDREGTEEGIKVVGGEAARGFMASLVEGGEGLVMLDATAFEFGKEEVVKILEKCAKLKVGSFSAGLESGWKELFESIGEKLGGLEELEIVGVPGEAMVEKLKEGSEAGLDTGLLEKLSGKSEDLKSVKVSILRTKGEHWLKENGTWRKQG